MSEEQPLSWTFLTNHSHVLICLSRDPDLRLRDLAQLVGITDRAVSTLIDELEAAGYVKRTKVGRRNRYEVHADGPMRHQVERGHQIGELIDVMGPVYDDEDPESSSSRSSPSGRSSFHGLGRRDRATPG